MDLGEPPEIVLTEDQKKYYAAKLLALEPENEKALVIINSWSVRYIVTWPQKCYKINQLNDYHNK